VAQNSTIPGHQEELHYSGTKECARSAASKPETTPTSITGWVRDMQRFKSAAAFADGVMSLLPRICRTITSETDGSLLPARLLAQPGRVSAGRSPGTALNAVNAQARQPLTRAVVRSRSSV